MKQFWVWAILGILVLSGCKPDRLSLEIYTSDIPLVLEEEQVVEVSAKAIFILVGEDEENLLEQAREVALQYVAEGSAIEKVPADFGEALSISTKIPLGTEEGLEVFLQSNPRVLQVVVHSPAEKQYELELQSTPYLKELSEQLGNINFLLGLELPAESAKFRLVGDERQAPTVGAIAVFHEDKPYLRFSAPVPRRESVELEFRGGSASVYSQISPQVSIRY